LLAASFTDIQWVFGAAARLLEQPLRLTFAGIQANRVYKWAPRQGSCAERHERILKMLPDALRLSRFARDIHDRGAALSLWPRDNGSWGWPRSLL
jgi:hypothetical protein